MVYYASLPLKIGVTFPPNATNATTNAGKCPYVRSTDLSIDPIDSSTTILAKNVAIYEGVNSTYLWFDVQTNTPNLVQAYINTPASGSTCGTVHGIVKAVTEGLDWIFLPTNGAIWIVVTGQQYFIQVSLTGEKRKIGL